MNNNVIVTEITASGGGHYMVADIDGMQYKAKHDDPCTWKNRDAAFKKLLRLIPEEHHDAVKAAYTRYSDGIKKAEEEAERLANMTDEERMQMFMRQMAEMNIQQEVENTEYEEVHEQTEA